ncbi:MAG: rubrerythrin [Gammaproteobacteria bacterium]|nr:rubrerythrin [Gammaproteobacteria bacterium]
MKEGHGGGYQKLSEQKTLSEVLEVAVSFEKVAFDFYSSMVPKVSKNIRYLLEELAEEEEVHYNTFTGLKADPEVLKQLQEKIQTPVEDHKFSDYTHLPEFKEDFDDQAILQYALGREDSAMKQYQELADNSPDGPLKSVFQFLAYEETQHKKELEKKYYELINQGGPSSI